MGECGWCVDVYVWHTVCSVCGSPLTVWFRGQSEVRGTCTLCCTCMCICVGTRDMCRCAEACTASCRCQCANPNTLHTAPASPAARAVLPLPFPFLEAVLSTLLFPSPSSFLSAVRAQPQPRRTPHLAAIQPCQQPAQAPVARRAGRLPGLTIQLAECARMSAHPSPLVLGHVHPRRPAASQMSLRRRANAAPTRSVSRLRVAAFTVTAPDLLVD